MKFQFRFTPWKEVLDWFAQQADLSLVLDVAPQGTFNYTDAREYTTAQAIDLLNSILLTKGYTLVRRDRMLLLINLEDGIPANLVTRVSVEDLDERGDYELVSCLFSLKRATAEEIETEIAKLLGPQGSIVVLSKARQVLVTETGGKLRTIRDVIEAVDNPQAAKQQGVRVLELKSVTAEEFLTVARPLLGMPGEQNELADGSLRIAVDPQQPRLFVSGKSEQIERVEELLKLVDVPRKLDGGTGVAEFPQLEVYPVAGADSDTALQVLQTLLAGLPDVRLATDPVTGNLIAMARPSEHATIKATLAQLQRDVKQIEVITLRRIDPQLAMASINKLFSTGGDEEKGKRNAPIVDADPSTSQLIIRGSESQIAQIRGLLEKMGETSVSAEGAAGGSGSNFRVLPFAGRPAREALEQVQLMWPTMRKNPIRVITPSAGGPGGRPGQTPDSAAPPPGPAPEARTTPDNPPLDQTRPPCRRRQVAASRRRPRRRRKQERRSAQVTARPRPRRRSLPTRPPPAVAGASPSLRLCQLASRDRRLRCWPDPGCGCRWSARREPAERAAGRSHRPPRSPRPRRTSPRQTPPRSWSPRGRAGS